jgi:DNA (cytosine-5)-methyltransferase 1
MKYFSTFSGIGGFELGITQAYENIQRTQRVQQRGLDRNRNVSNSGEQCLASKPFCVGYSEIDKYAQQIYQAHFPNHKNYGDITKINEKELPDFDLLVGGFPCQSFSIAGKRGGFSDTRGTMFFELARIIKEKQPRLFVFENVKGLLSHDQGRTFTTIITTLDELGYDCQWQVLNSKNHGVPQNRERVFIIGHLRGTRRPQVFPFGEADGEDTDSGRLHQGDKGRLPSSTKRQKEIKHTGDTHNKAKRQNSLSQHKPHSVIRRLTPTECERLQGFPDGWTEGISDTQRYKTLGNAVTVNVIEDIFTKILFGDN